MGSTRLPRKVLADLSGKTMIERVVERVTKAQSIDKVIVATTDANEDDELEEFLKKKNICDVFRGSVDDVLSRFYECAKYNSAEIIVRVTADDPLKDPHIIDKAIHLLNMDPELDYCSNTLEPTYPEGLDIEVIKYKALERAHNEARLVSEREHVTPYIWKQPEIFNVRNFKLDRDLNDWRWTVDRQEDLEFMRNIYKQFSNNPLVPYQEVIDWLTLNPQILQINSGIPRNEGYIKSINLEKQ